MPWRRRDGLTCPLWSKDKGALVILGSILIIIALFFSAFVSIIFKIFLRLVATYFLLGFASALLLAVLSLGFTYTYLKRSRTRNSKIKGYLDLIPDLTEEQRAQVQEIWT